MLEPGSYVEENAALQAGTRVEAGALIPGGQLWGGNPARYVKDLDGHEIAEIRSIAEQTYGAATDHAAQSTPWGNAYVQTEALRKALDPLLLQAMECTHKLYSRQKAESAPLPADMYFISTRQQQQHAGGRAYVLQALKARAQALVRFACDVGQLLKPDTPTRLSQMDIDML